MAGKRLIAITAVAGIMALNAAALPSFGSTAGHVGFAKPVFVDKVLAGGEPSIFWDPVHKDFIYTSHEGTTHTLHDGVVTGPTGTVDVALNYRNQVNIWTSKDGVHWTRVDLDGTGFVSNPATNTGFSDPDLTQDDGGRIYNTGIDLVNDALFSSGDGGKTWDIGTINCHEGDRPWLAGANKNEVFLATDTEEAGHTIYRSTNAGASCGSFGIEDFGDAAGGQTYTGFGKLFYNRANGSLVEPVNYSDSSGNASGVGFAILPNASQAFDKQKGAFTPHFVSKLDGYLSLFPTIDVDSAGNIYETWADNPKNSGKNSIWFAMFTASGKTIVKPHIIAHPGTTVLWPTVTVGHPGNAAIAWYQYDDVVPDPDASVVTGNVRVYEATLLNQGKPTAKQYVVNASGRPIHSGGICQSGTTCVVTSQDRRLGDYFTDYIDAHGCVLVATGDTTTLDPLTKQARAWSLPLFLHQNAGPSLTGGNCTATSARPVSSVTTSSGGSSAAGSSSSSSTGSGLAATGLNQRLPLLGAGLLLLALAGALVARRRSAG